eukprot:8365404-Pyramimonas_sp.AAC.1
MSRRAQQQRCQTRSSTLRAKIPTTPFSRAVCIRMTITRCLARPCRLRCISTTGKETSWTWNLKRLLV